MKISNRETGLSFKTKLRTAVEIIGIGILIKVLEEIKVLIQIKLLIEIK